MEGEGEVRIDAPTSVEVPGSLGFARDDTKKIEGETFAGNLTPHPFPCGKGNNRVVGRRRRDVVFAMDAFAARSIASRRSFDSSSFRSG